MKHSLLKLITFIALCFGTAGMSIPSTANARPLQVSGSVQVNLGTPHHYHHRRRRRTVVVAPQIVERRDHDNRGEHHDNGEHRGNGHQNKGNRGEHKGDDKH